MHEHFPPLPPGARRSGGRMARLERAAQAAALGVPAQGGGAGGEWSDVFGQDTRPPAPDWLYARVTAAPDLGGSGSGCSGSGADPGCDGLGAAYGWEEVIPMRCGGWDAPPSGLRGTNGAGGAPAKYPLFEANGDDSVPVGTVVMAWRGYGYAPGDCSPLADYRFFSPFPAESGSGRTFRVTCEDGSTVDVEVA